MNKLKDLRQRKGLTLKEVAERADTSIPQIQRLENGDRRLTTEWIERLSKALNCHPSEIVPEFSKQKEKTLEEILEQGLQEARRIDDEFVAESLKLLIDRQSK